MTTHDPSKRRPDGRFSKRSRAEEASWESEERLSPALEASRLGFWELDLLDHNVNRSLQHDRIFGYVSLLPAWAYEMFLDHVVPDDRAMVDEEFQAALVAQGDWNSECRIRRADGEIRRVWVTGQHRPSADGQECMAGFVEDITERKEVEAGLEKTRKELAVIKRSADEAAEFAESLINTVREPLISLDQDLRVVTVSRSFCDFFKVKPEDTVGQLIYDLGNKQWDIPKLRELLETILSQRTSFDNYEVEHDFAGVGRRTMLLNARQIQQGKGKERIILLAIEDITERKEVEAGLEETRKELEAFAYSVSHDLRAPLRGIDGWSLALLEDYKDKLGEQGREYIDLVRSETQRMGCLIDDLLTFSRQNRGEMKQERLDMTAIVEAIAARLRKQMPSLQAEFVIQPGLTALGDANLIGAALTNLLDNAAKFSSGSPHAVIEFGQVDKEGKKAFFVRDNGVGFDMAYADKLFGVFQRLHKASDFPGTGIGLASVQRIISRHGGRIWAEAKLNEGAIFHFTLKEAS